MSRTPAVAAAKTAFRRLLAMLGLSLLTAQGLVAEPLMLTTPVAVQLALEHHESIALAQSQSASARAQVRAARADGLPDLSARFDYTRNWLLPSILFNDAAVEIGSDNEMLGLLRLRQPLYTGGMVTGQVRASRSRVLAAGEGERLMRQRLQSTVETALYDYLLADEILRVRQLALGRARSNQQQVGAMRDAGRATRFDQARARVQVASALVDSIESAQALTLTALDVRDVIGLDLAQDIVVRAEFRRVSTVANTTAGTDDLAAVVAQAIQQRPERRQAAALEKGHEGDEQAARAGVRPRLDLLAVGQMQFQDDTFSGATGSDDWRRSWSTGLTLEVPLFEGMRSRARVAQAREARRQTQLQIDQLERAIEREVRQAWMAAAAATSRLDAQHDMVNQARIGFDDASARYRAGAGTQLEVMEAQLVLADSESEVARARRDRAVALVQLELATGTLGEGAGD